jgi:hypothetical protein
LAAEKSTLSQPWHAAVSEKTLPEARRTGPRKGSWEPGDHLGEEIVRGGPGWRQAGVYFQPTGGQKANSGYKGAFFILDHATDAGSIELPVTSKDGKLFIASNELQNTSGTKGKAEGAYKLKVQICNPSYP